MGHQPQKPCRFFHRWEFLGGFRLASRCRKCGLCKVENLLTERVQYGYLKEVTDD